MAVGHQRGLLGEAAAVGGRLGQMPERGADAAPSRVDAGHQQQAQRAQDVVLLERLAVRVLGREQVADQVVAGLGTARLQVAAEVLGELGEPSLQHVLVGGADLEDVVDPLAELVAVAVGDAEHVGDDAHGDVLGIVDGGVAAALVDEGIDQLVADGARLGDELVDGLRREGRQQHHARGPMARRVGGDGRRAAAADGRRVVAHDHLARGEMLGVVGDGADVVVAGRQVGAPEALGVGDRALGGADAVPDRKRVLDPPGIEMVPVGQPIRDRRALAHCTVPAMLPLRSGIPNRALLGNLGGKWTVSAATRCHAGTCSRHPVIRECRSKRRDGSRQ